VCERRVASLVVDKCISLGLTLPNQALEPVPSNDCFWSCMTSCFIQIGLEDSNTQTLISSINIDNLLTNTGFTFMRAHLVVLLKKLLTAWEEELLGSVSVNLQYGLRTAIQHLLEDSCSIAPLYKCLLQIIFTTELRGNCLNMFNKPSSAFAQILKPLAPFQLEKIHYTFAVKEYGEPLATILKNSPKLNIIELHYTEYGYADSMTFHIRKYCTNLKVLVLNLFVEE
ncbi:unnamed protein product, partial [Meganyctiphanes norvegica]